MQIKKKAKHHSASLFASRHVYLLMVAVACALYARTLFFQYTYHDDVSLVEDHRHEWYGFQNPWHIFSSGVFDQPSPGHDNYYRPMLMLTFYIDAQWSRTSTLPFRITNILLHALCVCMLYKLLLHMHVKDGASLFWGLAFACHPLLVPAVAWIPGRNDSLLALLALSSIYFLMKYFETRQMKYFFSHAWCFMAALLTKESAMVLPFVYAAYAFYGAHTLPSKYKWMLVAKWIGCMVVLVLFRHMALGSISPVNMPSLAKLYISNFPAALIYIGKMALPFPLCTFPILADSHIVYGTFTVIVTTFVFWKYGAVNKHMAIVGASILVLFTAMAIVPTTTTYESYFLEHRAYMALAGFILLLAQSSLLARLHLTQFHHYGLRMVLILYTVLTLWHSAHYKNELAYFTNAVQCSPHSSFAHHGLATHYHAMQQIDTAEVLYQQAIALCATVPHAKNNLGKILMDKKNYVQAEKLFSQELSENPNEGMAYYNMGLLYYSQGNAARAEYFFRKCLSLDAHNLDAHNDLSVLLSSQQRYAEAMQHVKTILTYDHAYSSALTNAQLILSMWGDSVAAAGAKKEIEKILAK